MQEKKYQPVGVGMTPSTWEAGKFLRSRRLELGLTQDEIARRTGMFQETYSALERGRLRYNSLRSHRNALATALQCDPSDLQVFIPDDPQPQTALGRMIRTRREDLGITTEDVAARARLNIATIHILEMGTRERIQISTADALASALQLDVAAFNDFIGTPGKKAPEITSPLGRVLRARRYELGLTLSDLAQTLHTSRQTISYIERGTIPLTQSDRWLEQLASVLGLDAEYLRSLRQERKYKAAKKHA